MRPARPSPTQVVATPAPPTRLLAATFAAQIIAQFEPGEADIRTAANAYDAVEALAYELPKVVVATL